MLNKDKFEVESCDLGKFNTFLYTLKIRPFKKNRHFALFKEVKFLIPIHAMIVKYGNW